MDGLELFVAFETQLKLLRTQLQLLAGHPEHCEVSQKDQEIAKRS
jgi:hypothetical protein